MSDLFIKQRAEKEIENLHSKVGEILQTSDITEKDYHFEFSVKEEKNSVKVLVYFGKKGVRQVIQGNPSESLKYILSPNDSLQSISEPEVYIGSDETGKGDVFGPLVTCAYYVDKSNAKKLKEIGVRDSKTISDKQIFKLASEIKKLAPDNFEIIAINPQRYNELYEKFKNINELLNWSHSKAIENLHARKPALTIITDKFRKKDLKFSSEFKADDYKLIQETKAEKYTAVAAASILARSKQLQWFESQKKNGIELKRGASEEVKELVRQLISQKKVSIQELAKMHFKTVSKLL
jgi:ribonuclease HIII